MANNSNDSMSAEKKKRTTLANAINVGIPPVRTRTRIDDQLNHEHNQKIAELDRQLDVIRLKGGPAAPKKPAAIARGASDAQKEKHKLAREKYLAELKKRDEYESEDYKRLNELNELVHNLNVVKDALMAKNTDNEKVNKARNEKRDAAVKELTDKAGPHAVRLGNTDLKDPKAITARLTSLVNDNPSLELLVKRHEISSEKYRISDGAMVAIATLQEQCVSDIAEYAIGRCTASQHKRVQADHAVTGGYRKLVTYPFWHNLACVRRVEEKVARHDAYEVARSNAQKKYKKRTQRNPDAKPEPFSYPTFPETEVAKGKAHKHEETKTKKDGTEYKSVTYTWVGIDADESDDVERPYDVYVRRVFKDTAASMDDEDELETEGVLVSTGMCKFLNDVCCELANRFAPQLHTLMTLKKNQDGVVKAVKTVKADLVMALIKNMMYDSYTIRNGDFALSADHANIINIITAKCEKHQQYVTSKQVKKEAPVQEAAVVDPLEADEADEVEELEAEPEAVKPVKNQPKEPEVQRAAKPNGVAKK